MSHELPSKIEHSGEIVTEDFYVPETDTLTNEFEIEPSPSFTEGMQTPQAVETDEDENIQIENESEKATEQIPEHMNDSDNYSESNGSTQSPEDDHRTQIVDTAEKDEDKNRTIIENESENETKPIPENISHDDPEENFFVTHPPDEDRHRVQIVDAIEGMEEGHRKEIPLISEDAPKMSVQFRGEEISLSSLQKESKKKAAEKSSVPTLEPTESRELEIKTSRKRISSLHRPLAEEAHLRRTSVDDTRMSAVSDAKVRLERGSVKTLMARESVYSRRDTVGYTELGPRFAGLMEDNTLMGFEVDGSVVPLMFEELEEAEEEAIVAEELTEGIDRKPFYERHDQISDELSNRKIKSFVLQKKLAMYFRRKKMDYVTKETDWSFDQQIRYYRKLEAYGEFLSFDDGERARINEEISVKKKQRKETFNKLTIMFKKMQSRESDIGYGLINTKTGNVIPDKHVERFIHRQFIQMGQVSSMRLTFIRLKQMVQEKLDAISMLDEIAPGLKLADFEHLKLVNQSNTDKIEEKDEELCRLRNKCASTIQTLAHLREKSEALNSDWIDLKEEFDSTDYTYSSVRIKLNQIKQERDTYRHNINKIRDESGLLTQPTLLRDMEQGLIDVKVLSAELDHVMTENTKRSKQIKAIRKKIEDTKEMRRLFGKSKSSFKMRNSSLRFAGSLRSKQDVYKGRPSLQIPEIDDSAFDILKSIKPQTTFDRRRHQSHAEQCEHHTRRDG